MGRYLPSYPPFNPRDRREVGHLRGGCLRTSKGKPKRKEKDTVAVTSLIYLCRASMFREFWVSEKRSSWRLANRGYLPPKYRYQQ